jgi:hypothetical protein
VKANFVRKAALLMSLMEPDQVKKVLATQSAESAASLKSAISQIARNGWNRRQVVESALGIRLDAMGDGDTIGVEDLMGLAERIDSSVFSRVLVAVQLPDPDFVISMLDLRCAQQVRESMRSMPTMPNSLRAATLASAARLLDDRRQRA